MEAPRSPEAGLRDRPYRAPQPLSTLWRQVPIELVRQTRAFKSRDARHEVDQTDRGRVSANPKSKGPSPGVIITGRVVKRCRQVKMFTHLGVVAICTIDGLAPIMAGQPS